MVVLVVHLHYRYHSP
jgi:hypothetical protein